MTLTPTEALRRLRLLYRNAHHISTGPVDDVTVLAWASPLLLSTWATHKIRSGGWSFDATQTVVRDAKQLQRRAILAPPEDAVMPESPITGADPFDALLPIEGNR
jgi:hypothetical protein